MLGLRCKDIENLLSLVRTTSSLSVLLIRCVTLVTQILCVVEICLEKYGWLLWNFVICIISLQSLRRGASRMPPSWFSGRKGQYRSKERDHYEASISVHYPGALFRHTHHCADLSRHSTVVEGSEFGPGPRASTRTAATE